MTNIDTIREARNKLCELELNLCNYDDDDVRQLQNNMLEGVAMLDEALAAIEPEVKREEAIDAFRMDELDAVMISVDKWFDEGDQRLKLNPATRAADAREIALKAIEKHDPDAIRRGILQKVAAEIKDFHSEITWGDYEEGYKDGTENALAVVDAAIVATDTAPAILGTESARDEFQLTDVHEFIYGTEPAREDKQ